MRKRIDKEHTKYEFDNLAELSRWLVDTKPTWTYRDSAIMDRGHSWTLGASYDDAVRMARDGWLEGAQRAQEALKAFNPKSPAPESRVDFYGHMPHVPRFCAGAPDAMIRHHKQPTIGGGRVLTLYVAVNMPSGVRAECASNYGLGVVQYISQLEADGIRVELYAAVTSHYEYKRGKQISHTWLLKHADQPLDLAVIAFAIGHPAMYRRLWFALMERSDWRQSRNYYYPADVTTDCILNLAPGAYVLNGMLNANTYAPTPEKALENIEAGITRALEEQE